MFFSQMAMKKYCQEKQTQLTLNEAIKAHVRVRLVSRTQCVRTGEFALKVFQTKINHRFKLKGTIRHHIGHMSKQLISD